MEAAVMKGRDTRRWWALGAITLAVMAAGLDATVLSLALPTLTTALHASESQLQWFVTGYTLALAVAMLPSGLLGDRFGRKRVMLAALALFGLGSVVCAFSTSPEELIAARVELGLAGAALTVMALSAVTVLFPESERPRAVGIWSAANFLALPLGPILGGWMLANFWWGWVFLINVPVVLVGLIAIVLLMPESRSAERPGLDVIGLITSSAGLSSLMYGLIQAGENGWGSASAIAPMVAAAALLAAFVVWEARLTDRPGGKPLIDIGLFRSGPFTWGIVLAGFAVFGLFGALFGLPQYFQAVLGTDAQGSGLRLLPLIGGMVAGAVPADRIAARIGPKFTAAIGFIVLSIGMAAGGTMTAATGDGFIAAWTFTVGVGAGISLSTAAAAALNQLSAQRSGVGSALMQTVTKLGPAFGAAILGSVLNSTYQAQLHLNGLPGPAADAVRRSVFAGLAVAHQLRSAALLDAVRTAFVAGMDSGLRVSAAIALAGAVLALAFLPRRAAAVSRVEAQVASGEYGPVA
ncbi:MAG: DHA2 family efflux MFS transporter permease subunit [Candidatus Dormibacteraeota bacterium]|nr:DHA2 family efflux MFS transporter permease subunit [Candidatus Dormibacteraeota bacterium]